MNSPIIEGLKKTDASQVALKLNCSYNYVYRVLNGDREARTVKAKAIVKAARILVVARQRAINQIDKLQLDAE